MYEITHSEKAMRLLAEEDWDLANRALTEIGRMHPEGRKKAWELSEKLRWPGTFW